MLPHDVIPETHDWAFGDHRAAVNYIKAVTDGETEIEVLLDGKDVDFSVLFDLQQRVADLSDNVRLNALGRFVEDQNFGI